MPYRIDLANPSHDALDRLIALGALDVDSTATGVAAILPDSVAPDRAARALGIDRLLVSPAVGRDDGSVWVLNLGEVRAGRLLIVPGHKTAPSGALRLIDSPAFGTGLHPSTALCLEALESILDLGVPARMLDVGTGSGVLALAALIGGVPHAIALDIDADALLAAAANAQLNGLAARLHLVQGGPEALRGSWPLVVANVTAAPLIEMAPALVQRVAHGGQLVLSGIPSTLAAEVEHAYHRLGMRLGQPTTRAGWTALTFQPSW